MTRREFIASIASCAVWSSATRAEQTLANARIGVLMSIAKTDARGHTLFDAFLNGLEDAGWVPGRNATILDRWGAGDNTTIRRLAADLVALAPDVILANSTPSVAALKQVTQSIPIVAAQFVDPVGVGLVASLSRPGGNITGFTYVDLPLVNKWQELLKEAAPDARRAFLIFSPQNTPFYPAFVHSGEPGPLELIPVPVRDAAELERAIRAAADKPGGAIIAPPDPFTFHNRALLLRLVQELRLPMISVFRELAAEGGLMSYGPDEQDICRRSASYVDRILRGANPGELPVQAPTKFELVINSKSAQALGITLPGSFLVRADEVID